MKNRVLGDIAYARSGDKGPNVNVGVIFKNTSDYNNALDNLTEKVVKSYFGDMVRGDVTRYELPNLNALNFICQLRRAQGNGHVDFMGIPFLRNTAIEPSVAFVDPVGGSKRFPCPPQGFETNRLHRARFSSCSREVQLMRFQLFQQSTHLLCVIVFQPKLPIFAFLVKRKVQKPHLRSR